MSLVRSFRFMHALLLSVMINLLLTVGLVSGMSSSHVEAEDKPLQVRLGKPENAPAVQPTSPARKPVPPPEKKKAPPKSMHPVAAKTPLIPERSVPVTSPLKKVSDTPLAAPQQGPKIPPPTTRYEESFDVPALLKNPLDSLFGKGDALGNSLTGEDAIRSYGDQLSLWLKRHQYYPEIAINSRMEGDAVIELSVKPDGTITQYEIVKSTGYGLLDDALHVMMEDANPAPAMPASMRTRESYTFRVRIGFSITLEPN